MSTRVLFGTLKGSELPSLRRSLQSKVSGLRPTISMARSTLFNVLQHNKEIQLDNFTDLSILDLCCGTGIVGIEFLSQGANTVSFVDASREVLGVLQHNLKSLGLDQKCKISVQKAPIYIPKNSFDIIFFDPPYDLRNIATRQMELIVENQSLTTNGVFIFECDASYCPPHIEGFKCILSKRINGKTKLTFWKLCKHQTTFIA